MDIEQFKKFGSHNNTKAIKAEFSKMMLSSSYVNDNFPDFAVKGFYRARKHNHVEGKLYPCGTVSKFTLEKEFWNPPAHLCFMGRCNDQGVSILYSSNRITTALLETKPEKGDFVTIAKFDGLLLFNREPKLRINAIGSRYLSNIEDLKRSFKNYKYRPNQSELDDLLDEFFHAEDSSYYKYSVPISEIFLTNGLNSRNEVLETDGVIYSSIIRDKESFCYAIKPHVAKRCFQITSLQTFEILEKTNSYIEIKLLRESKFQDNCGYNEFRIPIWKLVKNISEKIDFLRY